MDDYAVYRDEQNGKYMEIEWRAARTFRTYAPIIHEWGGYIQFGQYFRDTLPTKYLHCVVLAGVSVTYNAGGTLGFKCLHNSDEYHDFPYVLNILKKTINAIIRMIDVKPENGPKAINDFLIRRNAARDGAIAVIGALRSPAFGAGTGDVAKIIARVVWSTRVFYK